MPHVHDGKFFRFLPDIGDILLFPLLHTTSVTYGIITYKLEHSFWQRIIDQVGDVLLALFIVNFRTIIVWAVISLLKRVFIQIVVFLYPCR